MKLNWIRIGLDIFEAQTDLGVFRIIQQEGRAPLMLKVYHNSEYFASAWDIKSAKTYVRRKYNTLKYEKREEE